MHRYKFVLYRPLQFLPVLFGISVITFILVRLIPGDPARVLLGTRATPEAIARIRAQYGLDEPMWPQYFYFLRNLADGEMGHSILYKIDVLKLIATRIEPTLTLVLCSVVLSVLIAVPVAAIAARNQGRLADQVIRIVSTFGIGFPPFWLGLMLIILFSVELAISRCPVTATRFLKSLHISCCRASLSRCRCRPFWRAACVRRWSKA